MDSIIISVILSELQELDNISNCELSSSDDDDEIYIYNSLNRIRNRDAVPRVDGYFERIIPLFSETDFKSHFRMNRSTLEMLVNKISPNVMTFMGRPNVDAKKQLMMTIWLLANQETFRSISDRFDVSKSTLWTTSQKICRAISALSREVIIWPTLPAIHEIERNFQNMSGFPGVIGAIDGCHIPIKAPTTYQDSYVNRKGFHSILLQAVVDHELLFTDCYIGEAGSLHDARVFRRSHLGRELQNVVPLGFHLIGDSAYPLNQKLLTPFRDNGHLSRAQKNYNKSLCSSRASVERGFALLKGRFRRLKFLDVHRTDLLPILVGACCVMHNICQRRQDFVEPDEDEDENDFDEIDDPQEDDNVDGAVKRQEMLSLFA